MVVCAEARRTVEGAQWLPRVCISLSWWLWWMMSHAQGMQGARCGGGVSAACNDAGQGRGCDGIQQCGGADLVLSFGWTTHSSFTPQHVHVACTFAVDAPLFLLIHRHCGRGSMASNKKSGLTGYLPDILMAAAAVRLRSYASIPLGLFRDNS
jgi:hypothetical protein